MASAASRVRLKVPTRLTWTTVTNLASEWGPWRPRTRSAGAIPAQLTAAYSPPSPSAAAATAARALSSSVTSAATNRARSPSPSATCLPRSASTSATTTEPPASTTIRAVAAPSPDPPPVTSTVLPAISTWRLLSDGAEQPGRPVGVLPLEAAAHARAVRLGHRLAVQDQVEGAAEQGPGDRLAVAGGAVVEGAPVGEAALGIVDEQVGGAHGPVGGRDLLGLVEQVGEAEAGPSSG